MFLFSCYNFIFSIIPFSSSTNVVVSCSWISLSTPVCKVYTISTRISNKFKLYELIYDALSYSFNLEKFMATNAIFICIYVIGTLIGQFFVCYSPGLLDVIFSTSRAFHSEINCSCIIVFISSCSFTTTSHASSATSLTCSLILFN